MNFPVAESKPAQPNGCYLLHPQYFCQNLPPSGHQWAPFGNPDGTLPSSSKTSAECDLIDPILSSLNACLLLSCDPMHFWFCLVPFPGSASSICILVYPRNCFISLWGPCPEQSYPFYGGNHYSMLWTPNPTPLILTFLTNCRPESSCWDDISQTLHISNWSHNLFPKTYCSSSW